MATNQRPATPQRKRSSTAKQAASIRLAIIISACAVALIAIIGLIIGLVIWLTPPKPDERIIDNVYAGGVNLGGMTREEAKRALHLKTDNTYSKQDMVINLPDATLRISPALSCADLDVDAVVQEAYEYGRTGSESEQEAVRKSAATTQRTIPLLRYLNLNKSNIQKAIYEFCDSHSSEKTAPHVERIPEYKEDDPTTHVPQMLILTMGTPEYKLQKVALYNLVLDYYSLHKLTLNYADHQALLAPNHSEPSLPNAQQIFNQYCKLPKDAVLDEITYTVPEANMEQTGWGFDVEALQKLIDKANYGQVIEVQIKQLLPEIKAKDLLKDLFEDTLAKESVSAALGSNWFTNASLACDAINNWVVKPGEDFSFNLIVGQPSADKGYVKAPGYIEGKDAEVLGNGISQTATALYYCVLKADLEILERHNHQYLPGISIDDLPDGGCMGFDAYVDGLTYDLRFRNNTKDPLRILATVKDGKIVIELIGTNELDYFIELEAEQVNQTKYPTIIHQYVDKNNVFGYTDGQVLQTGIIGYDINSFKVKYSSQSGVMISRDPIVGSAYDSRNQIVAEFPPVGGGDDPDRPIDPDVPIDPDIPIDPDVPIDPNVPINPDENTPIVTP